MAHLITPPRIPKHRYCGVLAPNARLRRAVTATAGAAGATLQLLQEVREKMGMAESEAAGVATGDEPGTSVGRAAAHSWALMLARIFECLPLACPNCGEPMRIIAFILDRPVIERILTHIGEPTEAPKVWPARGRRRPSWGSGGPDGGARRMAGDGSDGRRRRLIPGSESSKHPRGV